MRFTDRGDAGRQLAAQVSATLDFESGIVLGVARGGVAVAWPIANYLNIPLDVWLVRKLGAPHNPELGVGAIALFDVVVWDEEFLEQLDLIPEDLTETFKKEKEELERRLRLYRGSSRYPSLHDKVAILVDDGMATGISLRASLMALYHLEPGRVVVALPVCSKRAAAEVGLILRKNTDALVCLEISDRFNSVALWYQHFGQVADEEVKMYLRKGKN